MSVSSQRNGLRNIIGAFAFCVVSALAADQVVGANQTLNLNPSAQAAASGGGVWALPGSALTAVQAPLGMLDLNDHRIGISHTAYYEGTSLEVVAGSYVLDSASRIGVALTRFGADDIPWIKATDTLPADGEWNTLSIADYVLGVSFARRLPWHLSAAGSVNFLYRQLDQKGLGFRSDADLRWQPVPVWFVGGHLEGWSSSIARWESEQIEYSPPELYLATGFHVAIPYLYGSLSGGYQSAGLLRAGNRALESDNAWLADTTLSRADSLGGKAWWDSPWSFVRDGRLGMELAWDWGGAVRMGWQSLSTWDAWTVGAGVRLFGWMSVDYAFERHPSLSGVHRISLELRPWWRSASSKTVSRPEVVVPVSPIDTTKSSQPPPVDNSSESGGKTWEE